MPDAIDIEFPCVVGLVGHGPAHLNDQDAVRSCVVTKHHEPNDEIASARQSLDECQTALEKLAARCCRPERSPRMEALEQTIVAARAGVDDVDKGDHDVTATIAHLEDAGAQIGWLQVGCCAPNRLPLYHTMLEELTATQRSLKRAVGTGH